MNSAPRVLYYGPEDTVFKKLSRYTEGFQLEGRKPNFHGTPQKLARSRKASVIILKIKKELDIQAQEWLSRNDASVPVIVLCQNGNVESAIHALQYGIFDYFCTSQNFEAIADKIREAILWKNTKAVKRPNASNYQLLLGKHPDILAINERAKTVASSPQPLLLFGEPGTGKEYLAQSIHQISSFNREPFVRYDCRLLKHVTQYDNVALSELILLRLRSIARKSSSPVLFLAHMEQLTSDQQKEILNRFGNSPIHIMASYQQTGSSLFPDENETEHLTLNIPPLRRRKQDIPILAEHFVGLISNHYGVRPKGITEEVYMLLQEYHWPGNIQELSNLIERMIVLEPSSLITAGTWRISQGYGTKMKIDATNQFSALLRDFLESCEKEWPEGDIYNDFIARMEKLLIDLVLPKVDYNQAEAAKILGISRNTLRERKRHA
jgi:DNA-binding NtrC family response regulator